MGLRLLKVATETNDDATMQPEPEAATGLLTTDNRTGVDAAPARSSARRLMWFAGATGGVPGVSTGSGEFWSIHTLRDRDAAFKVNCRKTGVRPSVAPTPHSGGRSGENCDVLLARGIHVADGISLMACTARARKQFARTINHLTEKLKERDQSEGDSCKLFRRIERRDGSSACLREICAQALASRCGRGGAIRTRCAMIRKAPL